MSNTKTPRNALTGSPESGVGSIRCKVTDGANPAASATIKVLAPKKEGANCPPDKDSQNDWETIATNDGRLERGEWACQVAAPGDYLVQCPYEGLDPPYQCVRVSRDCEVTVCFDFKLQARVLTYVIDDDCDPRPCARPQVGDLLQAVVETAGAPADDPKSPWPPFLRLRFPASWTQTDVRKAQKRLSSPGPQDDPFGLNIRSLTADAPDAHLSLQSLTNVDDRAPVPIAGSLTVAHRRRIAEPSGPMAFFVRLLDASKSIGFNEYRTFVDRILCGSKAPDGRVCPERFAGTSNKLQRMREELSDHGVGAYELLRTATEAFLLLRCCVRPCGENGAWVANYDSNPDLGDYRRVSSEQWRTLFCDYLGTNRLPYIERVIDTAFPEYRVTQAVDDQRFCADVLLRSRVENPCFLELIWNYWHEEGMLVQSINAVSRRFQNLRAPGQRDPLAHMEIDPLRPLNNILWGYVEDERDRLSIKRRAYEYQHQYGLSLYGKAVADLRPADVRSKFIEAFHNLLNKCADYYRAKQDTTVDPDGYPILHAIQELNLILAQGAHNQYGDLAWKARVENLVQQWLFARPELRDFLQSRAMVPYKEAWMPQVDTMKTLQGWTDVVVTHFRDLGVFGEQILLTIRWYNWYDVTSEEEAKDWADLLRAQIQGYIHAYRAVTGVDLANMEAVDYTMPSVHLRKRLAIQQRGR